jgi:hypothetical protein
VRVLPLALIAVAGAAAGLGWQQGCWELPGRCDPRVPLVIAEPPALLTRWKLARLSRDPVQCRAVLAQTPWRVQPVADRSTGEGCGLRDAVRIDAMRLRVGEPFTLTCAAAVSLAMWERHTVLPAADRHLGRAPVSIEHFGSYACRNLYGRDAAPRSRHATADALDVAGFVLDGGRRIGVARDWGGTGPEARFLRDVHRGACRWFDAVLGPDHNAAHADHLHLDRGPARACR